MNMYKSMWIVLFLLNSFTVSSTNIDILTDSSRVELNATIVLNKIIIYNSELR